MTYQVLDNEGFHDFVAGQYSDPDVKAVIDSFFAGVSPITVNTGVDNFDSGAQVNLLTANASGEIAVANGGGQQPFAPEFVADNGPYPAATEDFDLSNNGFLEAFLTAPTVDFTLSDLNGFGYDTVVAGAGTDTIDASASTDHVTIYTGSGNETVDGASGPSGLGELFMINAVPGFDTGTSNTISIVGGGSGPFQGSSAIFVDHASDANVSTGGGVTTVDFISGQNAGQVVTLQNVQTIDFAQS